MRTEKQRQFHDNESMTVMPQPGSLLDAVPENRQICVAFGISAFVPIVLAAHGSPRLTSEAPREKQVLFDVKASVVPGKSA